RSALHPALPRPRRRRRVGIARRRSARAFVPAAGRVQLLVTAAAAPAGGRGSAARDSPRTGSWRVMLRDGRGRPRCGPGDRTGARKEEMYLRRGWRDEFTDGTTTR